MVITDKQLDFSPLVGFQNMVHKKMKRFVHTPKSVFSTWDNSFKKVYDYTDQFTPKWTKYKDQKTSVLPWGENEWMLYHTFRSCMRKKVTPILREINILYEHDTKWKKGLPDYCTVLTGFYPEYENYQHYCFLLDTDYEESVIQLFSLFPTTPFVMETGNHLLIFVALTTSDIIRNVFCAVYNGNKRNDKYIEVCSDYLCVLLELKSHHTFSFLFLFFLLVLT
jgi:hypothetical protein